MARKNKRAKRDKKKAAEIKRAIHRANKRKRDEKKYHSRVVIHDNPRWHWHQWDPDLAPIKAIEGYGLFKESEWKGDRLRPV